MFFSHGYSLHTFLDVRLLDIEFIKELYANDPDFDEMYESCSRPAQVGFICMMNFYFTLKSYTFHVVQYMTY